jgi:hypothetical protein
MRRTPSTRESAKAAKRRRLVRLSMILAVVFLLLGLAVFVSGVGTYVIPVVVILGGVSGSFALLVWVAGQLDDRWYRSVVEDLIRYNRQRATYELERSEFIQQRKAVEEQYNEAIGGVTTIMPVGASVSFRVPEDLGRAGGYEGNRYDISNTETEEGPRLSVTKRAG